MKTTTKCAEAKCPHMGFEFKACGWIMKRKGKKNGLEDICRWVLIGMSSEAPLAFRAQNEAIVHMLENPWFATVQPCSFENNGLLFTCSNDNTIKTVSATRPSDMERLNAGTIDLQYLTTSHKLFFGRRLGCVSPSFISLCPNRPDTLPVFGVLSAY
eukprot:Gb_28082 [translate_table: standard]